MSLNIVDKRKVSRDRTTENRARFLRRIKQTIQDQLPDIINGRTIKDMDKSGGNIKVGRKTITEPQIWHTDGGNDQYITGDQIQKPNGGSGKGKKSASDDPTQTEDDFIVELSREEFLEAFFEGLELPDMLKTQITKIKEYKRENAGFQPDGAPNRLNIQRSYKQSFARRLTVTGSLKSKIKDLEDLLFQLKIDEEFADENTLKEIRANIFIVEQEIAETTIRLAKSLPMFEEMDLRYRSVIQREIPVAHATMIMIMDNSGSMTEREKTIARKFFWLLYSFLRRTYEQVDMRFISHTTEAHEMEEEEFFNTRESGGTKVSSALELTATIAQELLNKTNIYVAQVSDGDNYDTDNGTCSELLEQEILPYVRYMAYMQVDSYHDNTDSGANLRGLWRSYKSVSDKAASRLSIARVYQEKDIFPVFRDLFKKKSIE
jgi:uncharacterized sporulation protein YeaH/YhbH (DUF444 family)